MTSTRWAIWLGTVGAGACLALGAGQGVAGADTESPGGAGAANESTDTAAADTSAKTKSKAEDKAQDKATDDQPDADDASDPAVVPRSTKHRGAIPADSGEDVTPKAEDEQVDTDSKDEAESTDTESTESTESTDTDVLVDVTPPATVDKAAPVDKPATTLAQAAPSTVTGVQTGHAKLTIPVGAKNYTTRADWYLPTQLDGSVAATGVIWLQHGFLGNKASMSKLAQTLSQQTNSIVLAPNLSSFPIACSGCWINGAPMQEAVASLFLGDRASLNLSATAAGFLGTLPESFVMSGHSAGGGFATAVGGYYTEDITEGQVPTDSGLRGVVMFDGFSFNGVLTNSLNKLDDPFVPVYQIAAPPQPFNAGGSSTRELVTARPGQFVGATLAFGSHADAIIGGNALFDFFAQLATGRSPAGNTQAAYTLSTGWINDMYQGLTPLTGNGIYGLPDQYIVMGDTAAIVLAPPPFVDLASYLGTWFEVGSVKQFFSIGLVNTTAKYSLNLDGSIKVENSGNYFTNDGPESTIVGSALPVDTVTNNKLNVKFFGAPAATPPGNYWIVDLDPDYQWAVVSDSTGRSGFLLTREQVVSADFYQELLDRASVYGVKGRITPTRQPSAGQVTTSA